MINACLKDIAKVSRSDYNLPFFSDIHKQNINKGFPPSLKYFNTLCYYENKTNNRRW